MGRSGSSSKRKHSKKKSLKISSEARRKKRSKRTKSKKLRHHDDSFSSYSDDDSTSSSLLSSSSSEGEYISRKSRSRSRNKVKTSKKRTRRRSSSEDSFNASLPLKKRKRPKIKADYEKKKKNKKKKIKRDGYISSSSSDSASCSTCGDDDSDSDEDTIKGKTGNKKNRSRHRTSRPISSPSNSYDENIENVTMVNNPRRLKSVITIATQTENEQGDDDIKRDEHKEEMVYDYEHDYDYPSCKSNDSNDEETKKVEKDNNGGDNLESEADDLEAILRKKALENLSRYRGTLQTKPVVVSVDDNKQNHDQSGADLGQSQSQTAVSQPEIQKSRFTWRRDPSVTNVENKIIHETSTVDNSEIKEAEKSKSKSESESTVVVETPSGSTKEGSSKGQQNESNENSQFEKKTMSVMRGGEMVQVSYKVYIPNRAPALARRQLKR